MPDVSWYVGKPVKITVYGKDPDDMKVRKTEKSSMLNQQVSSSDFNSNDLEDEIPFDELSVHPKALEIIEAIDTGFSEEVVVVVKHVVISVLQRVTIAWPVFNYLYVYFRRPC